MMDLIIDTSVLIEYLRLKDKNQSTLYKLIEADHQLAISLITHSELYSGKSVWQSQITKLEVKNLLLGIKIYLLTEQISEKAGLIRAKSGGSLIDAIIAATALEYKVQIVTFNVKDFEKIEGIRLFDI